MYINDLTINVIGIQRRKKFTSSELVVGDPGAKGMAWGQKVVGEEFLGAVTVSLWPRKGFLFGAERRLVWVW